ncbi:MULTISPECIES: PQQ-binding-like beta-propeller repeat protein [unclassified Solwaraspora]|uniref:outer membrane protein assembly factor BamB family protein n=1 Tax=unclassified Solwaraspora TaxID=2627926 RepID=UPI00259B18C2|nr:PQQ-binding-like beta-propeller repeat protein [Solwaraspora sp. WMMA2056]WJK41127.1 PQQ-binding-like beta-propeller repeat protein [Solwaraspora sp. WMMA2056]
MAKGSAPCVKCYLAFALVVVIVLAATGVWNPFPGLWDWVNRSRPLADPDVTWQQRVDGAPQSITVTDRAVIVEHRLTVEGRSITSGNQVWEHKADWAAVAGTGTDQVVVAGTLLVDGYQVLNPATGALLRRDEAAVAVWTYRNALLDVECAGPRDCTLRAWDPRGQQPRWTAQLPGMGLVLFADNPQLLTSRPLTARGVADDAGGPQNLPAALGFPIDGKIHVVETRTGKVLQELKEEQHERIVVLGGRVFTLVATPRDGACYYTATANDPVTALPVWQRAGINLRTADRTGCAQRHNPTGGPNVLAGVAPDMRETVIDAHDGRVLWTGAAGQELRAVDDRYALARSADGATLQAYALPTTTPAWTRDIDDDAQIALTRYAALVTTRKPDRVVALDPATGTELANLRTSAEVKAVGPAGMVIGEGREIGYVRFAGADLPAPAVTGPGGVDPGPTCGGVKQESCPGDGSKDG